MGQEFSMGIQYGTHHGYYMVPGRANLEFATLRISTFSPLNPHLDPKFQRRLKVKNPARLSAPAPARKGGHDRGNPN